RGQGSTVPGKNYYNRPERKRTKTAVEDWRGALPYDGGGGAAKTLEVSFTPLLCYIWSLSFGNNL
ncbi:hypothetical protein JWG42_11015, partial [Desulfoprunum benzoelyticum]|uniref:hypothetical protein n=1 Tax=Desulfoprunum benzoelyticum TaxID=1506996 RepID=UPI0019633E42